MIEPNWYPTGRQLRQFAVIALFGFGLVGAALRWRFGLETAPLVLWAAGAATFVLGMITPKAVLPIYTLLMGLSVPIGWAVSNLFLRIIYYGIMTPFGIVLRATGRDPLKLKKPQGGSYWRDHKQRESLRSYYRQA